MGTTAKCTKCNQEHDLSLAQCPTIISRVLPPTGPKPSPSAEAKKVEVKAEEPAKVVLPTLASMQPETKIAPPVLPQKVEAVVEPPKVEVKADSKPKMEARPEEPSETLKAPSKITTPPPSVMPALVAPKEEIPSNTKSSSPSLEALAATLETSKPASKSEPRKETMIGNADALVMPPQTAKDKALGLYQGKVAPMLKGKEKLVAGVAGGLALLLIAAFAFSGDENPTAAPAAQAPTQNSPLFASQPTEPTSEETEIGGEEGPAVEPGGMVPIEVNVTPTEAVIVVWVDGAVFKTGASPLSVEVPSGSSVEVTLAAAGYSPEQKTFKAKGKKTIKESLSKLGAKPSNTGGGNTKKNNNSGGWGGWGGK